MRTELGVASLDVAAPSGPSAEPDAQRETKTKDRRDSARRVAGRAGKDGSRSPAGAPSRGFETPPPGSDSGPVASHPPMTLQVGIRLAVANLSCIAGGVLIFGDVPSDPVSIVLQGLAFLLVIVAAVLMPAPLRLATA